LEHKVKNDQNFQTLSVQNRIQVHMHPWMVLSPSLNTTSLVHVRAFTYILSRVLVKRKMIIAVL